jgi:hypothetical protein
MICTIRIPDVLQARIDAASAEVGRSKWILEACRLRLDRDSSVVEQRGAIVTKATGSIPVPDSKPDMQALRAICAGKLPGDMPSGATGYKLSLNDEAIIEVEFCGKTWWEDGEQYECLMDKGHKALKCGQRGMVRRIES